MSLCSHRFGNWPPGTQTALARNLYDIYSHFWILANIITNWPCQSYFPSPFFSWLPLVRHGQVSHFHFGQLSHPLHGSEELRQDVQGPVVSRSDTEDDVGGHLWFCVRFRYKSEQNLYSIFFFFTVTLCIGNPTIPIGDPILYIIWSSLYEIT